jgi:hypothetical protein
MVPGLADRFVTLLPSFVQQLYSIGVSPGAVTVQIDNHREFMRFAGHVAMSVGQVFTDQQACDAFKLHDVLFEVRTQPKVWREPVVRELYVFDAGSDKFASIPNH